jgi:hypothetical protein
MGRPISGEYRLARRILTGSSDPSGLNLNFELDGSRVFARLDPKRAVGPGVRVLTAGPIAALLDDLAHATVAALRKRVGITREARIRLLKPPYTNDALRADGHFLRETGGLFTIAVRLLDGEERLCVEGEIEVFALQAEQLRRMTQDGMLPVELRRFCPT